MSKKKIDHAQLVRAAAWVQHEVLDPWLSECEALLAAEWTVRKEEYRAQKDVLMRLTKSCQRLIEKEPS